MLFPLCSLSSVSICVCLCADHGSDALSCSFRVLVKEGIYLFQHGQDPYAGAVYRSSPLLVVLFSLLDINNDLVVDALYLGLDLACAWLLATITKSRRRQGKVRGPKPWMMAFLCVISLVIMVCHS